MTKKHRLQLKELRETNRKLKRQLNDAIYTKNRLSESFDQQKKYHSDDTKTLNAKIDATRAEKDKYYAELNVAKQKIYRYEGVIKSLQEGAQKILVAFNILP